MVDNTFEAADFDLIRLRREDRNRLGVGLQLALLRYPGTALAQILDRVPGIPEELLSFIGSQLDIPAEAIADYAARDQTMTDHARELAVALGLRGAAGTDIPFMIAAAADAAPYAVAPHSRRRPQKRSLRRYFRRDP